MLFAVVQIENDILQWAMNNPDRFRGGEDEELLHAALLAAGFAAQQVSAARALSFELQDRVLHGRPGLDPEADARIPDEKVTAYTVRWH